MGQSRECFLWFRLGGGTRQLVVAERGEWQTVGIVTHAMGVGTRKGIHRWLGYEKSGAVDVDEAVVTVCGCFLFFFVVYDVV